MTRLTAQAVRLPGAMQRLRLLPTHYIRALAGIVWREWLRFLGQRGRFFSALVRPLVWLGIFAAGFRFTLGVSIIPRSSGRSSRRSSGISRCCRP